MLTVAEKQADLDARIAAAEALGKRNCPECLASYERGRFYRPYFICASCGHRWSENPITQAMGEFLEKLHVHEGYPWDWFVTLTFARAAITPAGAQYLFKEIPERNRTSGAG